MLTTLKRFGSTITPLHRPTQPKINLHLPPLIIPLQPHIKTPQRPRNINKHTPIRDMHPRTNPTTAAETDVRSLVWVRVVCFFCDTKGVI